MSNYRVVVATEPTHTAPTACQWIADSDGHDVAPMGGPARSASRRKAGGSPRKRGSSRGGGGGGGGGAKGGPGAGARRSSRPALRRTKTAGTRLGAGGGDGLSRADFNWKCMLGKGAVGRVRLAQLRSSGRYYAVKCISKALINEKQNVDHIRSECDILRSLRHPFIARLFSAFQDDGVLAMCLQYACGARCRRFGIVAVISIEVVYMCIYS